MPPKLPQRAAQLPRSRAVEARVRQQDSAENTSFRDPHTEPAAPLASPPNTKARAT